MNILVTGGAGFIGSAVCRHIVLDTDDSLVNVDKLTYAANLESLDDIAGNDGYAFEQADIADQKRMAEILDTHQPDAIMNLAAESHVDRSIDGPADFVKTNIVGTYILLEVCREYLKGFSDERQRAFRFHHVSTDEVYGSLGEEGAFVEETPYAPNSPYAASKAASDHLVRAWGRTYGLPVIISNTSNNYGPRQFPEKLIPLMILNALSGKPLPVYGAGENVRDWIHVEDHARALHLILKQGSIGEFYNVGGDAEMRNIDVVNQICALLDEFRPDSPHCPHSQLIEFVADRPGHDQRYAIDASKIRRELGWEPAVDFATGLGETVRWYLENTAWWERINSGAYLTRIGLG